MDRAEVILVDEDDQPLGVMEKMEAHRQGKLHRAFSIFVLNNEGEMLLQRRSLTKYHSPGLWTNACCSHPGPGELTLFAASRRLKEEMGFSCSLTEIFTFTYETRFDNGLTEHEYDHVFLGIYDGKIDPDPAEVEEFKWFTHEQISTQLSSVEAGFSSWFKLAYPMVKSWLGLADS